MSIKGSRTEQNLLKAFAGESMARNKYLFFAEKARQEGHEEISKLFESMAQNEGIHGKLLYKQARGIGSSLENLQEAIQGEYSEWSSMYPEFAKIAREEGFEDIAILFDNVAKIEKDHEFRFLSAFAQMSKKIKEEKEQENHVEESKSTITVKGYRCMFCGAVYENQPDVCGVCEAIGSFEPTTIHKEV